MKKFLISSMVLLVAGASFASASSTAGIVDQPKPLRLKILTKDGKPKIKVGKTLPTVIGCSKDCSARVTVTLVMPAASDSEQLSRNLPAGGILRLNYRLTGVGRNYLSDNYRASKLKVKLSAKDVETGKRVIKTRTFRFYK